MLGMNDRRFSATLAVLAVFLCVPVLMGSKKNLADYTLRIHLYDSHWTRDRGGFHAYGRANLYDESGMPHAVDYLYDCDDHMMAEPGNEAYPARWKKPAQSIEVIYGEIGQRPDDFHTCEFKISEKSFVYFRANGGLNTESPQDFMTHHAAQAPPRGPLTPDDIPHSANPNPN